MSAQEVRLKPDFRERAKANDVPVGRLIGFEARDIADGRATVVLAAGPQHANPMGTLHGGILCDIADAAMGMAFASTLTPEESFTTVELEDQFLSSGLAGRTQSERNRGAAGPHDWLRRMQYNRRGEPAGRESGFDVHGASRAEGIRTVIPHSLAARLCDTAGING